MQHIKRTQSTLITLLLAGILAVMLTGIYQHSIERSDEPLVTGHGNPATLTQHYRNWKRAYEQHDGAEVLTLALTNPSMSPKTTLFWHKRYLQMALFSTLRLFTVFSRLNNLFFIR